MRLETQDTFHHPIEMKKLLITAALAVVSIASQAASVDVSNFVATANIDGKDFTGRNSLSFQIHLTDSEHRCSRGTLEAIVTSAKGTGTGCWRIIGDQIYITQVIEAYMGNTMIPMSSFKTAGDKPFPAGK